MQRLEEKLIEQNWLQPWQLDRAIVEERNSGRSLWINLVRLGFLSEQDIILFLAQEGGIPYADIKDYAINQAILRLVEENFSLQNRVIPLFKLENTLFVACSNPLDTALLDSLAKMTGLFIEPLACEAHAILAALDLHWRLEEKNFDLARLIIRQNIVQGYVPWRQAERLFFKIPVKLKLLDETVVLISRQIVAGSTVNLSSDGTAVGVMVNIYLPKGIMVLVSLSIDQGQSLPERTIELRGEIVRSAMARAREYFLGIRLTNVSEAIKKELLAMAALK